MRRISALLTLLIALTMAVQAATPQRYELDIKEFDVLKVIDGVNVDYRCNPDSAGRAVFTTTPGLASVLMFSNDNGKLSIQMASEDRNRRDIPLVTVYSTFLNKVENAGDSTVRVVNVAPCAKFQAILIGNGRLAVHGVKSTEANLSLRTGNGVLAADGTADELKISFSGTGTIQADEFPATKVSVRATGTGAIGCAPDKELSIVGAGSTKIYHKGTPTIKNRSIGIKTFRLDSAAE